VRARDAGARQGRHVGAQGKIEALLARARRQGDAAVECLFALLGRTDEDSEDGDRAFVGALMLVEFMGDVRMLRRAYVKVDGDG
jgi:hypothetical protein